MRKKHQKRQKNKKKRKIIQIQNTYIVLGNPHDTERIRRKITIHMKINNRRELTCHLGETDLIGPISLDTIPKYIFKGT